MKTTDPTALPASWLNTVPFPWTSLGIFRRLRTRRTPCRHPGRTAQVPQEGSESPLDLNLSASVMVEKLMKQGPHPSKGTCFPPQNSLSREIINNIGQCFCLRFCFFSHAKSPKTTTLNPFSGSS